MRSLKWHDEGGARLDEDRFLLSECLLLLRGKTKVFLIIKFKIFSSF